MRAGFLLIFIRYPVPEILLLECLHEPGSVISSHRTETAHCHTPPLTIELSAAC